MVEEEASRLFYASPFFDDHFPVFHGLGSDSPQGNQLDTDFVG